MSFILDALRKSENERREQVAPTLATAPRAVPAKKKSIWLPILAVVLAINAIVFGALVLKRDKPAPVAAIPAPTAPPVLDKPALDPVPAPVIEKPEPAPAVPASKPAVRVTAPDPATSQTIRDGLPSFGQLRAANLISVPNLHVDMHVYSGDPPKRFVFINMSKYREGDRLAEGPTVEEITPEGVILNQQGQRFRLDRD